MVIGCGKTFSGWVSEQSEGPADTDEPTLDAISDQGLSADLASDQALMSDILHSISILGTGVPKLACLRRMAWLHQRPGTTHLHPTPPTD